MDPHRRRVLAFFLFTGDALCSILAIFLAFFIRFHSGVLPVTKGIPPLRFYLYLIPVHLLILTIIYTIQGLYHNKGRRTRPEELLHVLTGATLAELMLLALLLFYRDFSYSRLFFPLHLATFIFLNIFYRFSLRKVLQHLHKKGIGVERILIAGAGTLGKRLTESILKHKELGYHLIGFLDDDPGKKHFSFQGIPVLGKLQDAEKIAKDYRISTVYITLPLTAQKKIIRLCHTFSQSYVDVKLIPDILQLMALHASVEDIDGLPVVNLSTTPLEGWSGVVKRLLDIFTSLLALVLLSPLFFIIAILIKREDGGPVIYKQMRMGLDGKAFAIYKFRSMVPEAEAKTGPTFTKKKDPRVTRIGRFLRRYSLDELPQLLNVLKGDMSLVGPRPERPEFVGMFQEKYPDYPIRHRVRCGMTGWAQVNGYRGDTSIKKRLEYDLYYIENWSLALDLKIIWRTLTQGLWKNAF